MIELLKVIGIALGIWCVLSITVTAVVCWLKRRQS